MFDHALDLPTLSLVTILTALLLGFGFTIFSKRQQRLSGFTWFAAGNLLLASGLLLTVVREHVAADASPLLSNMCLLAGFSCFFEGVLRFQHQRSLLRWLGPVLTASLLLVSRHKAQGESEAVLHMMFLSGSVFLLSGLSALNLARGSKYPPLPRLMSAVPFAVLAFFALYRAWWAWGGDPLHHLLPEAIMQGLALVLLNCVLVLSSFGFLWLAGIWLEGELSRESRTDYLTQLYNNRALNEAAVREMSRAKRHGYVFSVIIMDIDRFRNINEKLGHAVGDLVLKSVARVLESNLRGQDLAGRFGGEEFLLLLPETNAEGAKQVAEKLRLAVQENVVPVKGTDVEVTASFGVAELGRGWDWEDLLRRADQAMYQAKTLGCNRVCVG